MSAVTQLAARGRRPLALLIAVVVAVALAAAALTDATPGSSPIRDSGTTAEANFGTGSTAKPALNDDAAPAPFTAPGAVGGSVGEGAGAGVARDATASRAFEGDVATDTGAVIEGTGGGTAGLGLKVLQNGSITVTYRRGRFDAGYARVTQVARSLGGYVVSSSRSTTAGSDAPQVATLTIRVPNRRFDGAIERVSEGGKVTQLDVTSEDVTQEYVDASSRLRHDQAVEARLMRLLGRADTVADALVVQDRLATLQQQIEVEKGRIAYLDKLTALATLEVTLRERGAAEARPGRDREQWGVGEAFSDAAHEAVDNVNDAIVWAGGALPGLLVLALVLWVVRIGWVRHRGTRYSEQRGRVARAEETASSLDD